jgi:hypothetical protein
LNGDLKSEAEYPSCNLKAFIEWKSGTPLSNPNVNLPQLDRATFPMFRFDTLLKGFVSSKVYFLEKGEIHLPTRTRGEMR